METTTYEALLAETDDRDTELVLSGEPIPPEVAERVRERCRRIRQRVLAEHGLVDIAVPGVREFRDR